MLSVAKGTGGHVNSPQDRSAEAAGEVEVKAEEGSEASSSAMSDSGSESGEDSEEYEPEAVAEPKPPRLELPEGVSAVAQRMSSLWGGHPVQETPTPGCCQPSSTLFLPARSPQAGSITPIPTPQMQRSSARDL